MDTITFIRQAVTQAHERLMASLEGLTEADVTWRPVANANTILEIAWHVARVDDRLGRRATGLGQELWNHDGWSGRLSSVKDVRAGEAYQFLKDHGVQPPRLDDIKAYLEAVHRDTLERLRGLSPADVDGVPDPRQPERNVAKVECGRACERTPGYAAGRSPENPPARTSARVPRRTAKL